MPAEELEPLRGSAASGGPWAARVRGGGSSIRNAALLAGTLAVLLIAPYLNPSRIISRMDEAYDRIPAVSGALTAASLLSSGGGGGSGSADAENRELKLQIARLTAMLDGQKKERDEAELKRMEGIRLAAAASTPSAATAAARELATAASGVNLSSGSGGAAASRADSSGTLGPLGADAARRLADHRSDARRLYRLTHGLIQSRCNSHGIILVTFVNYQRCDYAFTWAGHVERLGLKNYLVGAMDGKALQTLVGRRIPTFDMESGLTTADYGWGTKNFRQLGLRKCELILSLLRAGADPIVTDADALITRDPTPFIRRLLPEAQVLVTSDHLMSTDDPASESLEEPTRASNSAWNIGYFYLHHSALPAIAHWKAMCEENPTLWDQNLFKDIFKIGRLRFTSAQGVPDVAVKKRLFLGYNGTVTIGILPVATFCSGHTYFVQRMPQRRGVLPYSVHTTFQYSGAIGKTHRLREAALWLDEPAYYDPPGKSFLTYAPAIRHDLFRASGQMDVATHFHAVHLQLVQLRAALLLAARLGRILILPPLACGLDRFWAPHNGTIPGSATPLPIFPCPADHVLDLENGIHKQNGPIEELLREFSFLNNSRLPDAVRHSVAFPDAPRSLSEAELASLRASTARVLSLPAMPDLYKTLPPVQAEAAREKYKVFASMWCCSKPLTPKSAGHVFYDLFWDVVPHTDKFRRRFDAPWVPTFGP